VPHFPIHLCILRLHNLSISDADAALTTY